MDCSTETDLSKSSFLNHDIHILLICFLILKANQQGKLMELRDSRVQKHMDWYLSFMHEYKAESRPVYMVMANWG